MTEDWKCAGCGIISPDKWRSCDCPTDVVYRMQDGKMINEVKVKRMLKPTECAHMNFQAHARVGRLTDTEGGPVTGYTADIKIECTECGLPFRFRGLAAGSHYAEPRVSIDGTELRAPLEPAYTVEIAGHPLVAGNA